MSAMADDTQARRDKLARRLMRNRAVLLRNGHWREADRNRALSKIRALQYKTRHLVNVREAHRRAIEENKRRDIRKQGGPPLPRGLGLAMMHAFRAWR